MIIPSKSISYYRLKKSSKHIEFLFAMFHILVKMDAAKGTWRIRRILVTYC
jgi:hypothetical protein